MVIAIGVLLALMCLGVAAIPFLRYRHSRQTVDPTEVIAGLQGQRELIYKELITLEESSRAGAVPELEFNAVSETLHRRAAENLWLQHRWEERLTDLDEALEAIIAGAGIPRQAEETDPGQSYVQCPECGAKAMIDDTVCPGCGAERESTPRVPGGRA